MNHHASLRPLLSKELRALLPVWASAMAALAGAFVLSRTSQFDLAVFTYVSGALVVGAHTIGHEYANRTLPMLLAQPVSRGRVFRVKLLALSALLAPLACAGAVVFTLDGWRGNELSRLVALPLFGAVFAAPLFAMLCRSTLAGAILAPSAGMTLFLFVILVTGIDLTVPIFWFLDHWVEGSLMAGMLLGSIIWHRFARMEAVDTPVQALTLTRTARPSASQRNGQRHPAPWRALIAKEFRLLQTAVLVTLSCALISSLAVTIAGSGSLGPFPPFEAVLLLYCLGLTIVIGALASAGERQLGMRELQMLLPVSALSQWVVKSSVALVLSIGFGIVLPVLVIAVLSNASSPDLAWTLLSPVILLNMGGLYISSISSSGVKAMAWVVPAGLAAAIFIESMRGLVARASVVVGMRVPADHTEASIAAAPFLIVLVAPALWWFGYVNHTAAEHPWPRVLMQTGVLAALIVAGIVVGGLLI